MSHAPGTILGNVMRLERELGRGGMGVVWLATHSGLGRQVAVKVLAPGALGSAAALARFEREAGVSARIDSPHVVQVLGVGTAAGIEPYIVMELLRGRDLGERLRAGGPLGLVEVGVIVHQICDALDRAHARGIIHRDLKPANVFVVDGPGIFVKVLDFGIAKLEGDQALALTATASVVGTPRYMSPEQFVNPRGVDHRTDLWSLAVLTYACLTGRVPFQGDTVGALTIAVHSRAFAPPSSIVPWLPKAIDVWFERALDPDRDRRFQSAKDAALAFVAAAREAGSGAVPASPLASGRVALDGPTASGPLGTGAGVQDAGTAGAAAVPQRALATKRARRWLAVLALSLVALGALVALFVTVIRPRVFRATPSARKSSAGAVDTTACSGLASKAVIDSGADRAGLDSCEKLCASGDPEPCVTVGRALSTAPLGAGRDDARALELFRRACDAKMAVGCGLAGSLLARGRGAPRNLVEATALHKRGCDGKDADSCTEFAKALDGGLGIPRDCPAALTLLGASCNAGRMEDCSLLGVMYAYGRGARKDHAKAAALMKQACDGGSLRGCANYALKLDTGTGVAKDPEEAARLAKRACDGGDVLACSALGQLSKGDRSPETAARSLILFQSRCADADARACRFLSWRYLYGEGVAKDDKRAAELLQMACDGNDEAACVNLGQLYADGIGVSPDAAKSVELFRKVCDTGSTWGCENLGQAYLNGKGVPHDAAAAVAMFRAGCEDDFPVSCLNLGVLTNQGDGVQKDEARAVELWDKACGLGLPAGCDAAAYAYLMGNGVAKDEPHAAKLFAASCDKGGLMSCAWLGHLYESGRGVETNPTRAAELYKKACSGGDAAACKESTEHR